MYHHTAVSLEPDTIVRASTGKYRQLVIDDTRAAGSVVFIFDGGDERALQDLRRLIAALTEIADSIVAEAVAS